MSDLSPLSGEERKSNFGVFSSVDVKVFGLGAAPYRSISSAIDIFPEGRSADLQRPFASGHSAI